MIAVAAISLSDLFAVVMLFGVYSLLTAALFMDLDAVDVAFTEAAVGAGVTTVLMLASLHLTKRWEALPRRHHFLGLLVVGITGAALVYAVLDAPLLGDPICPRASARDPALHRTGPGRGGHAQPGDRGAGELPGL